MIKLEKIIFYIFLFSIPLQTRIIIWQWSKPFNEWTAGYIYLTDILLAGLLVLWLIRSLKKKAILKLSVSDRLIIVFLIISAFSIFNSKIIGLSFYRLAKLGEFALLYFYVKANLGGMIELSKMAAVVAGSGGFQAVIAIGQYLRQGSLGLKIFGESVIGINIPNVAVFTADGHEYLRSYGTFPHSNVLAAWLLLAIFAFYFIYLRNKEKSNYVWFLFYSILLFGFFFSFSRVAIFFWGISTIPFLFIGFFARKIRSAVYPLLVVTVITCGLFALLFWPQVQARIHISGDEEAVTDRIYYNEIAGKIAIHNPLGIGIGQFVADLSNNFKHYPANFYQPVHNIYLIILDEVGFIGLVIFLAFLISNFRNNLRNKNPSAFYFLFIAFLFLLMGLFDHFLWTLQQGNFIFWAVLAAANVINRAVDS